MRAVLKHQPGKGRRRGRAINGAFESLMYNAGQKAGVIDMSVCQKDKINISRLVDISIEVAGLDLGVPLMHAAVHGETNPASLNEIARTGDRLRRTEKMDFHRTS